MAKKINEKLSPPNLTISRIEAKNLIKIQVEKGKELLTKQFSSESDYLSTKEIKTKWSNLNEEILNRIFDNEYYRLQYDYTFSMVGTLRPDFIDKIRGFKQDTQQKITFLESLIEQLSLIPEPNIIQNTNIESSKSGKIYTSEIFIVHGHDDAAKLTVTRFLEKLDLKPIILHEQPNRGKTIIEKLEKHSELAYAVVLLTPDDIGFKKEDSDNKNLRARQNVVFELGYFIGKIGRENVCALHKGDLELPSDYDGVLYLTMDDTDGWQLKLAKEIKAAGFSIDLNKVL